MAMKIVGPGLIQALALLLPITMAVMGSVVLQPVQGLLIQHFTACREALLGALLADGSRHARQRVSRCLPAISPTCWGAGSYWSLRWVSTSSWSASVLPA